MLLIIIVVITIPTEKVMTGNGPPKFIEQEKGECNAESPYHNPHDCLKDKNKKSFHFKLFNVISKNR